MAGQPKTITPAELRERYQAGGEIAIVDAREEGSFHERHLLMASCLPLSRLELLAPTLLPRRSAPIVVCDAGGPESGRLAERAAARLSEGGWTDVAVLAGGVEAWAGAGYPVYSGVHVPSKAFAEVVEHEYGTPWISAEELAERQKRGENMVIFDSRSYEEYHSNSIPGAVSVPGAELVYRFQELVPSPDTFVVVNCGGRTRSIIGAQSLIDAGVPNPVVDLKDGTMAWHLAGLGVVSGADRRAPEVSAEGIAAAKQRADAVANRYGVPVIDRGTLAAWQRETDRRTLYVLDVRDPAEYRAGHLPGSLMAPGGQLVQETDSWLGHMGRAGRAGRRYRGQGADDRVVAKAHGLGRSSARSRARRRCARTGRAGDRYRHVPARRAGAGCDLTRRIARQPDGSCRRPELEPAASRGPYPRRVVCDPRPSCPGAR